MIALYSIFHLPKTEHEQEFRSVRKFLGGSGAFLATFAGRGGEHSESDWVGAPMLWSSHPPETYLRLLEQLGFRIEMQAFEGTPTSSEYHLWILCADGRRSGYTEAA